MRNGRRPLQNRVTPFGDVVAIAQRGLFIGNRGIIHDPATKTLLAICAGYRPALHPDLEASPCVGADL